MDAAGIPTTAAWRDVEVGPLSDVLDVVRFLAPLQLIPRHLTLSFLDSQAVSLARGIPQRLARNHAHETTS